jgi:hypothetical protein
MSKSYERAEALAHAYRSRVKPNLIDLAYSRENDFRVVHCRPTLNREILSDCDVQTFIVIGDRIISSKDRCGFRYGNNFEIVLVRKLTSVNAATQPAGFQQLDSCLEFTEWVQDQVSANDIRNIDGLILNDIELFGLPADDMVLSGIWTSTMELRYG